jgi:hypothetical protein
MSRLRDWLDGAFYLGDVIRVVVVVAAILAFGIYSLATRACAA